MERSLSGKDISHLNYASTIRPGGRVVKASARRAEGREFDPHPGGFFHIAANRLIY